MPKVHFTSPLDGVTVEVKPGTPILEAAEACGAKVGHSCGGVCACSTCHVWVRKGLESLSEPHDDELDRLDQADLEVWITEESLKAYLDENPEVRRQLEAAGRWPLKR